MSLISQKRSEAFRLCISFNFHNKNRCYITQMEKNNYIARTKQKTTRQASIIYNKTKFIQRKEIKTMKKENKWQSLSEFLDIINKDPLLQGIDAKMITRASNIGERMWILKYKRIYVVLFDLGNGYWEYFSLLSLPATIYSVIYDKIDFFLFQLTKITKRKETTKQ